MENVFLNKSKQIVPVVDMNNRKINISSRCILLCVLTSQNVSSLYYCVHLTVTGLMHVKKFLYIYLHYIIDVGLYLHVHRIR